MLSVQKKNNMHLYIQLVYVHAESDSFFTIKCSNLNIWDDGTFFFKYNTYNNHVFRQLYLHIDVYSFILYSCILKNWNNMCQNRYFKFWDMCVDTQLVVFSNIRFIPRSAYLRLSLFSTEVKTTNGKYVKAMH